MAQFEQMSIWPSRVQVVPPMVALVVSLTIGFGSAAFAAPSSSQETASRKLDQGTPVPGEARLEGRLLAPCCWSQTLDIHNSEIAIELRHEIRRRLVAGESPDAIEASLVARYGERLRAVPDDVPLEGAALMGWLAVGAAAVGAVGLLLRWRRRAASSAPRSDTDPSPKSDDLEARIDAELERLD